MVYLLFEGVDSLHRRYNPHSYPILPIFSRDSPSLPSPLLFPFHLPIQAAHIKPNCPPVTTPNRSRSCHTLSNVDATRRVHAHHAEREGDFTMHGCTNKVYHQKHPSHDASDLYAIETSSSPGLGAPRSTELTISRLISGLILA